MPDTNSLAATLALITKAMEIGGDIAPLAIRAFAALRAEHSDEELTQLARDANDLDDQKVKALIAKVSE